jgi:Reverse transcriptase (RNA-dependent DNA polymerase)
LNKSSHCLKILNNIYGGKESGRTWFLHLKATLISLGYQQLRYKECVFYKGSTIFFVYTDDGVLMNPNKTSLSQHLQELQVAFEIEVQRDLTKYLGIKIDKHSNGTIHLLQPQLIDSILVDLKLLDNNEKAVNNTHSRDLPSMLTRKIQSDPDGMPFDQPWHY